MKYKVGDKVLIKSLDWYKKNKTSEGCLICGSSHINPEMICMLGKTVTISSIEENHYRIKEYAWNWTDEMFEGLVKEETLIERVDDNGLPFNEWLSHKGAFHVPDGYKLKDENSNIINATKIVLEKKKPNYPETYEECCKIMGINHTNDLDICEHCDYKTEITYYEDSILEKIEALYRLIICRDAYWKIAGEEMGLGKPWEPDWGDEKEYKYVICRLYNDIVKDRTVIWTRTLAFPTEEMRDAFYENFKSEIEFCKELL